MAVKDLVTALNKFDGNKEILCQVVGTKAGAWNMELALTEVPGSSFLVLTLSHPQLEYLPSDCSQPVTHYECNKGHRFLALPDHPVVMGAPLCPHCVAKGGVVIP